MKVGGVEPARPSTAASPFTPTPRRSSRPTGSPTVPTTASPSPPAPRPVHIFIFHVSVGLPVEKAIRTVNAKMALVSHVLEMGHSPKPPQAWRWSYDFAFNAFKNIPQSQATVLTWGERWLTPGTQLAP